MIGDYNRPPDPEAAERSKRAYLAVQGLEFGTRRRHGIVSGLTDGHPDTLDGICEDYVQGRIDVDELERRVEARLRLDAPG